jgi:hypothetical protein
MEFLKLALLFSLVYEFTCQLPPPPGGGPPGGGGGPPGGGGGPMQITNYNFSASTRGLSDPMLNYWIKPTGLSGYGGYNNVNKVQYSSKYVYVSASGVPSWSPIGPWPG